MRDVGVVRSSEALWRAETADFFSVCALGSYNTYVVVAIPSHTPALLVIFLVSYLDSYLFSPFFCREVVYKTYPDCFPAVFCVGSSMENRQAAGMLHPSFVYTQRIIARLIKKVCVRLGGAG